MTTQNEKFNLKAEFKEQVEPILDELRNKCKELDLPLVASICFSNDDSGYGVVYAAHLTGESTPDHFYAVDVVLENRAIPMALQILHATSQDKVLKN